MPEVDAQVDGQAAAPKKRRLISTFSWVLIFFGYAIYAIIMLKLPDLRRFRGIEGSAQALAIGIFAVAAPICVLVGELFGNLVCPQLIITTGGWQALAKERLFWWVGPRLIGLGVAALGATYLGAPAIFKFL